MPTSINFKWPLKKGKHGYFSANETLVNSTTENLKMLLLTEKGERVIEFDFGTQIKGIVGALFEQIDSQTLASIENEIRSAVMTWMPHIFIKELKLDTQETNKALDKNRIEIKLSYAFVNMENLGDTITMNMRSNGE